jgi:hypothetical protein
MVKWDTFVTLGILLFIIFLIYTKIKNQTLKETFTEVKDLFGGQVPNS